MGLVSKRYVHYSTKYGIARPDRHCMGRQIGASWMHFYSFVGISKFALSGRRRRSAITFWWPYEQVPTRNLIQAGGKHPWHRCNYFHLRVAEGQLSHILSSFCLHLITFKTGRSCHRRRPWGPILMKVNVANCVRIPPCICKIPSVRALAVPG